MPTDLELIQQLEKEVGIKLREKEEIQYSASYAKAYQKDSKGHIIRLALEDLQLYEFPRTILKFKNLVYLSLYDNQLSMLPPEISKLTNLNKLYLGNNKLRTLPPEISKLTNLRELSLYNNLINTLPPGISKLTNLRKLSLYNNQLSSLPPEISKLTNLRELSLYINQLSTLPPEISKLTNLIKLDLSGNQLSTLPPEISKLTNLSKLDLSGNQLSALPPEISKLTNLSKLYLNRNQLSTLPPEISKLTNLSELRLYNNQLSSLPPEISKLTNLSELYLNRNQLSTLPPEISKLTNLSKLDLSYNPLKQPPPEIATGKNNIERIRNFFEDLEAQGEDFVYEAKLILVGEPGAGKTSLAEKLLDPEYKLNPKEPMTKGIQVKKWHFPYKKDITFHCNIWDFGGQEIMHSTHRYFLTKRSLYILVADNRKEDTDFYYWMNLLELLSSRSPLLIVLNEKFKYKKYVPQNIVQSFKSVQKVFNVNLDGNTGLADLSKAIQQYMCTLPHVGNDPIPKKWVEIRKDLETEKEKRNYITHIDYLKICKNNGIDDEESAGYISEFLHDLGVILHFQNDRILRNTIILNTRWATEAVYQILFDNTIIENGGEFDNNDLPRVWPQSHYRDKHGELLQLMLNFELCYEIGKTQKYIIPELLPEKPSSDKNFDQYAKGKDILQFEYRYEFMPKGIISRLIVRMNKYIYKKQQWKNGVVLRHRASRTEIVEYFNERILKIRIAGLDRLDTLAIIRKEIKDLHDTFESLVPHEMVPCNCPECQNRKVPHFFDFDELKQYKQEGEKYIKCRIGKIKNVSVFSLISDVFIKEDDRMKEESGDKKRFDFKQEIKFEGAKIEFKPETKIEGASAKADARAYVDISVDIDIKVDLPAIQNYVAELKELISDVNPKLNEELNRIEDSLDDVTPESDKEKLAKPMNKMRRFLEKIADENSDFHKAVKGAKKGIEMTQKVVKTYNKFAQWLALPQVPDLFLGK
ncbi:MAG TPA: COR domain-containing protein [Sedimentisphaerales bacterium]|nr:COR domain-containing protein [Sedimentisphaerales bacterium]